MSATTAPLMIFCHSGPCGSYVSWLHKIISYFPPLGVYLKFTEPNYERKRNKRDKEKKEKEQENRKLTF